MRALEVGLGLLLGLGLCVTACTTEPAEEPETTSASGADTSATWWQDRWGWSDQWTDAATGTIFEVSYDLDIGPSNVLYVHGLYRDTTADGATIYSPRDADADKVRAYLVRADARGDTADIIVTDYQRLPGQATDTAGHGVRQVALGERAFSLVRAETGAVYATNWGTMRPRRRAERIEATPIRVEEF